MNNFFKRNWIHFAAICIFLIVSFTYFSVQMQGYKLKQHDIKEYIGMSHEASYYRELHGEELFWSNSMFGGMPTVQTSLIHSGNIFGRSVANFLLFLPSPVGIVLLYMLGFYFLALMMKWNRWIGILGAVSYAFLSYNIIILQAGHNSKGIAIAFLAPVLGSFIMAFRGNMRWGIILSSLFMCFELASNHLQVTYYLLFLLIPLGITEFYNAFKEKTIQRYLKTVIGLFVAYGIALAVNYGNIKLTSDYAKHTIRGGNDLSISPDGKLSDVSTKDGLDRDYVTQYSYGVDETFNFISPYVKGGGSFAMQQSQFVDVVENSDLDPQQKQQVLTQSAAYWGDQPFTSGPAYMGIVAFFLAVLAFFYVKDASRWAFLVAILITVALSWGKNYMGLTNWFLDYFPGYSKFRAVTIILVITELCIPFLALWSLNTLYVRREEIKSNIKPFYIASGIVFVLLIGLKFNGLGSVLSSRESDTTAIEQQIESQRPNYLNQISQFTPEQAQQYGIDLSNMASINAFVDQQISKTKEDYFASLEGIKSIREQIFDSSINRSLLFLILAIGLVFLLFKTSVNSMVSVVGIGLLMFIDVVSVSRFYLDDSEEGSGYKYWVSSLDAKFPFSSETADLEILSLETATNSNLASHIQKIEKFAKDKASTLEATGREVSNVLDAYKFGALNEKTNYRVYEMSGGFNSSRASFFHKSLGGYHGAKLRSIQNLVEFHLSKSNNKVFDMLNVKYFIQQSENGLVANENKFAMGNAWFVKSLATFDSPNDEIRALGLEFEISNSGTGQLFVNDVPVQKPTAVFGTENITYLKAGSADSIPVSLTNGMTEGLEVDFVEDVNGKRDFIISQGLATDTTKSFTKLVHVKVKNAFDPKTEAVMLTSEAIGMKKKLWDGNGEIKLQSYHPHHLKYAVNSANDQFAVFSEIYYPSGWTAKIDGKIVPIKKVNYLLRGLEIPAGKHTVEFNFELVGYSLYNTLSLVLGIFVLAIIVFFGFKEFNKKENKVEL
jgi:hypothetical protein